MTRSKVFLFVLLTTLPFGSSLAEESSHSRFILLVDDNGRSCTTLIAKRAFEEAVEACDEAVDNAKVPITTSMNPHGHNNREALAVAYSNRAVLNWMLGDAAAAHADFARALRQNRHVDEVGHNQELVEARYLAQVD